MNAEGQTYWEAGARAELAKATENYNITLNAADYAKEDSQVRYLIDRFFGTKNGFTMSTKEVVNADGSTLKYRERDQGVPNVFDELKRLRLMLCGGAINSIFTNSDVNDLDFYMKDQLYQPEIETFFERHFPRETFKSINALTYKRKAQNSNRVYSAQLITRFTGEAQDIFNWFDFTITHGAYDFDNGCFRFGSRFFQDLSKKALIYSGASKYPICAMYRTKKYVDRGYKLSGATIMHIALAIVQLKIENYGQLKEQLLGIDTSYLNALLDKKAPTNPVDYGEFIYEAFQIIDRISGLTAAEVEDTHHQ